MLKREPGLLVCPCQTNQLAGVSPNNDVLVFHISCVINGAMLTYFLTRFRSQGSTVDRVGATIALLLLRPHSVRGLVAGAGNLVTEPADG